MRAGRIIIGALAGIAAGALVGILFAPERGSESRAKIVKRGEDYLETMKEKFNSLLDSISGKFDGGRVEVADIGEAKHAN